MKEQKELGFNFQEIGLQEAKCLVGSGSGKYADILLRLIKKLPEIENANRVLGEGQKQTLVFGLPGKDALDEKARSSFVATVRKYLKTAGLNWTLSYSNGKRVFVCLPREGSVKASPRIPTAKPLESQDTNKQILDLYAQGISSTKIAAQVGIPLKKVRYLCYARGEKGPSKKDQILALLKRGVPVLEIAARVDTHRANVYKLRKQMKGA